VLAGPGSGKTRVITYRIVYLISEGIRPEQILGLTFTNKAAEEMQARVGALLPGRKAWMGTYHRFCAQLLRRYARLIGLEVNFSIYDTEESGRILRRVIRQNHLDEVFARPEAFASAISWAKNNLIEPEHYRTSGGLIPDDLVRRIYAAYQEALLRANAVDFDDLLCHVVRLLREHPEVRAELDERFRFILVDEYQDTNLAQYAIARSLSIDHPNLTVTGDPDQSIYNWRGANLRNILEFEHDYPSVRVIRLEQNYRSTQRILRVAARLIQYNVRRKPKELFTENGEGMPVRLLTFETQKDEAQAIAQEIREAVDSGKRQYRDFAVFYRVNTLSRALEVAFRESGVPYQLVNAVEFFQRKEIKDLLAYLQLLNNPRDDEALLRILPVPPRGIGKGTVEGWLGLARQKGLSLFQLMQLPEAVALTTRRARPALETFLRMWRRLEEAAQGPVEELLGLVVEETGYRAYLESAHDEQTQERLANIEELLTVARDFDDRHQSQGNLADFLEEVSLVGETDAWNDQDDRVTLMTLHASKGLEFPVVYLIAVEEGILPHERARDIPDELEEERRLMFVGITRAREELTLTRVLYRDFRGQRRLTIPSVFLFELPRGEMLLEDRSGLSALPSNESQFYQAPLPAASSAGTRANPNRGNSRIITAAELAGGSGPAVHPDQFRQGMTVLHAEYGIGRIVALSGSGVKRVANVEFPPPIGRVKIRLSEGKLRPLPGRNANG